MTPKESAHKRIDRMRKQSGAGVWTYLHRVLVADQLDIRVDNPTKVNQGQVGLCAPAAFLEDLITDDPEHYVRMAHELFDLGFTHMLRGPVPKAGGKFLIPDEDLRTYKIPTSSADIPEADWLVLASIRQAYDFWGWEHFYKAKPEEGGTYANDLAKFFKDTGYSKVVNWSDKSHYHNANSAMQASQYVAQGYRVVLQINADLLGSLAPHSGKDELNHAVGLVSPIVGGPNQVHFDIFTWGQTLSIPQSLGQSSPPLTAQGQMTWATFLKHFFGFIAAKF